jgi:hypothetical protein
MKRSLVVGFAALAMIAPATTALADPPGPGDKQCTPGQNAQPQPGKKGGTCPGRK